MVWWAVLISAVRSPNSRARTSSWACKSAICWRDSPCLLRNIASCCRKLVASFSACTWVSSSRLSNSCSSSKRAAKAVPASCWSKCKIPTRSGGRVLSNSLAAVCSCGGNALTTEEPFWLAAKLTKTWGFSYNEVYVCSSMVLSQPLSCPWGAIVTAVVYTSPHTLPVAAINSSRAMIKPCTSPSTTTCGAIMSLTTAVSGATRTGIGSRTRPAEYPSRRYSSGSLSRLNNVQRCFFCPIAIEIWRRER